MPADVPDPRLLAWFEGRPPVTFDGALRFASALKRNDRHDEATDLLRDTWVRFDITRKQEDEFLRTHGDLLRRGDHIARLDRLLWKRRARAARRQARRISSDYVRLAEARLLLAFRRPGVDRAVRRVPGALREDPGFIYDRARWRRRKGRYKGVVELLDPPLPAMRGRCRDASGRCLDRSAAHGTNLNPPPRPTWRQNRLGQHALSGS